jgi:hypothetical protein
VDKDLPAPIGDCALTVTTRSKATTVRGGASLELDIAVEIMPRGGDLIPFGLTIPSWNFSPSATTETHSLYHALLVHWAGMLQWGVVVGPKSRSGRRNRAVRRLSAVCSARMVISPNAVWSQ